MTKLSAKERILQAADTLAKEQGVGHISLDAVAARAGVSKGGLLYHFPSKAALMRAMVANFVNEFEAKLNAAESGGDLMNAYIKMTVDDCSRPSEGAGSVLAALVEDPELLEPVKTFKRRLLQRLVKSTPNRDQAIIVFLAAEGLRSLHFFQQDTLTPEEMNSAAQAVRSLYSEAHD